MNEWTLRYCTHRKFIILDQNFVSLKYTIKMQKANSYKYFPLAIKNKSPSRINLTDVPTYGRSNANRKLRRLILNGKNERVWGC